MIAASAACASNSGGSTPTNTSSANDDGIAVSDSANDAGVTLADGLSSPRGLALDQDGNLLIAEVGGGRLLEVTPGGDLLSLANNLPYAINSGPEADYNAGPSAISLLNGDVYVIVGEFRGTKSARLYRITETGGFEAVTPETDAYAPLHDRFSNPYDIVNAPEVGGWIVADSGANALMAVDSDGNIRDYVVFPNFSVPDNPTPIETVPTGIARGPDGAIYVGSLTGYPYLHGQAVVWRVQDLNGDGDAMDEGEVEPYVTGLTSVTDITFGPDGTLYIAEFSSNTKAVLESGDIGNTAISTPGRVLKWDGNQLTVIANNVVSPTGLLATESTLYISEEYAGRVSERPLN